MIFLPRIPYTHRIYMVLANPITFLTLQILAFRVISVEAHSRNIQPSPELTWTEQRSTFQFYDNH